MVINEYLVKDLIELGIWSKDTLKDKIIQNDGSVRGIDDIPSFIQERYQTAWEVKEHIIDMASDR